VGASGRTHGTEGSGERTNAIDELLIKRNGLRTDENLVGLGVDFSVDFGSADELNDPFLGLFAGDVEFGGEEVGVDAVVKFAEGFENEGAAVVEEEVLDQVEIGVVFEKRAAKGELSLGSLEVGLDVEAFDEFGDRVGIGVALLLDHLDEREATFGDNVTSNDVTKHVRARDLDGLSDALVVVEVQEGVTRLGRVEKDGQRPMQQPRSLLQLHRRITFRFYRILYRLQISHRHVPRLHQNICRQFSPQRILQQLWLRSHLSH